MIVVDTGPLYAAADVRDTHHAASVAEFENATEQLVNPVSVLIETSFLIERNLGPHAEAAFHPPLQPLRFASSTLRIATSRAWPSSSCSMPTYRSAASMPRSLPSWDGSG